MFFNQDSIEIIEENLSTFKTTTICQHISAISDKIWGASFRKCTINDQLVSFVKISFKCLFLNLFYF